jgi:hypothetical protein
MAGRRRPGSFDAEARRIADALEPYVVIQRRQDALAERTFRSGDGRSYAFASQRVVADVARTHGSRDGRRAVCGRTPDEIEPSAAGARISCRLCCISLGLDPTTGQPR